MALPPQISELTPRESGTLEPEKKPSNFGRWLINFLTKLFSGAWNVVTVPVRLLMRLGAGVLAVCTLVFFLLSVSLPVVTTFSWGLFQFASLVGEIVTTFPNLLRRQTISVEAKLAEKEAALVAERSARIAATKSAEKIAGKLAVNEAMLAGERTARKIAEKTFAKTAAELEATATRAAVAQVRALGLAKKLAAAEAEIVANAGKRILYRGEMRLVKEVVADTSVRIGRRMTAMMSYDISGMVGQAVPYFGTTVIYAVTAYDLHASCEMMKDIHAMDVAFNPENAIDSREVCGMRLPTVDELASQAWTGAVNTGGAIVDWSVHAGGVVVDWSMGWVE